MIAIISDIHGNYPALQAVMNKIEELNCSQIISLGDVAGYYCMINECIDLLREKNAINILGNHDYYLTNNVNCPRSTSANICLEYQRKVITKQNLDWLMNSKTVYKVGPIWAVHGGWNNHLDEYVQEFDFIQHMDSEFKVFLSGHSHVQVIQKHKNMIYCNPGSVGQPRDNNPNAAFALIDENYNLKTMRVKYDIDKIAKQMKEVGFKEYLSTCLYYGEKIGGSHTCY